MDQQTEGVLTWREVHRRVKEKCREKFPAANPKGLHSVAAHGILMYIPDPAGIIEETLTIEEVFGDEATSLHTVNSIIEYVENNFQGKVSPLEGMKRLLGGELEMILRGGHKEPPANPSSPQETS